MPEDGDMSPKIVHCDLDVQWPDSGFGTGMVLVQAACPELMDGISGCLLPKVCHDASLQVLSNALALASKRLSASLPHSSFVLLPEYSLPAAKVAECEKIIDQRLPSNCVCAAGFDAMLPDVWQSFATGAANYEQIEMTVRSMLG